MTSFMDVVLTPPKAGEYRFSDRRKERCFAFRTRGQMPGMGVCRLSTIGTRTYLYEFVPTDSQCSLVLETRSKVLT